MKIRRFSEVRGYRDGDVRHPVDVILTWNPARPHEITLMLQGDGYPAGRWVFSRDLLTAGLTGPAGLGAVAVLPDLAEQHGHRGVELVLSSDGARVALPFRVSELREFLDSVTEATRPAEDAA